MEASDQVRYLRQYPDEHDQLPHSAQADCRHRPRTHHLFPDNASLIVNGLCGIQRGTTRLSRLMLLLVNGVQLEAHLLDWHVKAARASIIWPSSWVRAALFVCVARLNTAMSDM